MRVEIFLQIVEGVVEFPTNIQAESMIYGRNVEDDELSFVHQGRCTE